MEIKKGYSITTYKFQLNCWHIQWLHHTKEMYNLVLEFYYEVLKKEPSLLLGPKSQLMRQLEILTVGVRKQDKKEIKYPLPCEKVPLYFRRAAINDAIRLMHSYMAGKEEGSRPAKQFQASPIFYKGMYKDFTEEGISLKLWNGEKWVWEKCGLGLLGRTMPEAEKLLSPILKLDGNKTMLHVPVMKEVEDIRTVKEWFAEETEICAAAFPGNDCMAVLAVISTDGRYMESLFVRGGKQLLHEKQKLVNRMNKNRADMGQKETGDTGSGMEQLEEENRFLKQKIKNLTDTYSHRASRQMIDFCVKRNIRILVVPRYTHAIDRSAFGYLKASGCDWLGRRIIGQLRYKAFAQGIVVTSVGTKDTAGTCYICGRPVKRFNKNNKPGRNYYGGKNYICPNGHKGNANFNQAMNIGQKFLKSQGEIQG